MQQYKEEIGANRSKVATYYEWIMYKSCQSIVVNLVTKMEIEHWNSSNTSAHAIHLTVFNRMAIEHHYKYVWLLLLKVKI